MYLFPFHPYYDETIFNTNRPVGGSGFGLRRREVGSGFPGWLSSFPVPSQNPLSVGEGGKGPVLAWPGLDTAVVWRELPQVDPAWPKGGAAQELGFAKATECPPIITSSLLYLLTPLIYFNQGSPSMHLLSPPQSDQPGSAGWFLSPGAESQHGPGCMWLLVERLRHHKQGACTASSHRDALPAPLVRGREASPL